MKIAYVSGPITNDFQPQMDINRLKAISVAYKLREMGYAVICPHAESLHGETALEYDGWIEHDLKLLSICDVCFVCDGWKNSKGTIKEIEFSQENFIPIRRAKIVDGKLYHHVFDWNEE